MAAETLTRDERKNGWTETRLRAYLAERDTAVNLLHRLGAAGQQAPRRVVVEGADTRDPLDW